MGCESQVYKAPILQEEKQQGRKLKYSHNSGFIDFTFIDDII